MYTPSHGMRTASPTHASTSCSLCGQAFSSTALASHAMQCFHTHLSAWLRGDARTRGPRPQMPSVAAEPPSSPPTSPSRQRQQQHPARASQAHTPSTTSTTTTATSTTATRASRTLCGDGVHTRRSGSGGNRSNRSGSGEGVTRVGAALPPLQPPAPRNGHKLSSTTTTTTKAASHRQRGERPLLPMCYLCGQQFGTTSIAIHVPQCYHKQLARWTAADPHTRGAAPRHPDTVNWRGGGGDSDGNGGSAAEQVAVQYEAFVAGLQPCPHCARRFLADRLAVHLRSCRPGSTARPVSAARARSRRGDEARAMTGNDNDTLTAATTTVSVRRCDSPRDDKDDDNDDDDDRSDRDGDRRALRSRVAHRGDDGAQTTTTTTTTCVAADVIAVTATPATPTRSGSGIDRATTTTTTTTAAARLRAATNRLPTRPRGAFCADGRPCAHCHTVEYDATAKYCRECGHNLQTTTTTTTTTAAAAAASVTATADDAACARAVSASPLAATPPPSPLSSSSSSLASWTMHCAACDEDVADMAAVYCEECGGALQRRLRRRTRRGVDDDSKRHSSSSSSSNRDDDGVDGDNSTTRREELARAHATHTLPHPSPPAAAATDMTTTTTSTTATTTTMATVRSQHARAAVHQTTPPRARHPSARRRTDRPHTTACDGEHVDDNDNDNDDNDNDNEDTAATEEAQRQPCPHCQRHFAPSSWQRHVRVCARHAQASPRRAVYNATRHRMPADARTVTATTTTMTSHGEASGIAPSPRPVPHKDWRAESRAFRAALRAARQVDQVLRAGGKVSSLPPPAYDAHPEYVPCPHCGRRFAEDVAARHIPRCAHTVNRPKPPPSQRKH